MTDLPESEKLSAFARRIGHVPSYVTRLKADDRLVLTEDGKRVKVAESLARIEATADPNRVDVQERHVKEKETKAAAPASQAVLPLEKKPRVERSKFTQYRTDKMEYDSQLAKRNLDILDGKLVETAAVLAASVELGTALRAWLENLAHQIAPRIANKPEEVCEKILQDEIELILKETSAKSAGLVEQLATPPTT